MRKRAANRAAWNPKAEWRKRQARIQAELVRQAQAKPDKTD